MKIVDKIKENLISRGIENILEINQINGNMYFIKTEDNTYNYDVETQILDMGIMSGTNDDRCKLTPEEQEKIAEENIKLVHYVLKRWFMNSGIPYDELESVGEFGFAKALATFDKMKGFKFSTYAINCITNELYFFLRKEKKYQNTISINKELNSDVDTNNLTLEDTLEDEKMAEKGIDFDLMEEEKYKTLLNAIQKLDEDEQDIIKCRFGIMGQKPITQKDLAEKLHTSQANVSKIQRNCLKKLKFIMQKDAHRI